METGSPQEAAKHEYNIKGFGLLVVMGRDGIYTIPGNESVDVDVDVLNKMNRKNIRFIVQDENFRKVLDNEGAIKAFTTRFDQECYDEGAEKFATSFNREMIAIQSLNLRSH